MTTKPQIDKQLIKDRFERSFKLNSNPGEIQSTMASRLAELLLEITHTSSFQRVLELGCGSSSLLHELLKHVSIKDFTANDLVPVKDIIKDSIHGQHIKHFKFIQGDMESIDLPDNQDLIISNAAFQWLENGKAFITRLINNLAPDGILAFSTFGPQNLREISALSGVSLHYLDAEEYSSFLSKEGRILDAEETLSTLYFESPGDVLKHLKETGVNAISRTTWTRKDLRSFLDSYSTHYSLNGKVELTYHPVYVIFQRGNMEKK